MFDSGVDVNTVVATLVNEIDVALPIDKQMYADVINTVEQLMYGEIIREQKEAKITVSDSMVDLSNVTVAEGEGPVVYEDIHCVFCGDTQLHETTVTSNEIFPNTYCKSGNKLKVNAYGEKVRITYFVRPAIRVVGENGISGGNIHLPPQFLELLKAKVRGEVYRIAGEYAHASNWLNEYNVLLENFKAYIAARQPNFGL